jgi:hypothetical protein
MPLFFLKEGRDDYQVKFNKDKDTVMPGYFQGPSSGAADSSENIYIADTLNNRILKFSKKGNLLKKYDLTSLSGPNGPVKTQFSPVPADIVINGQARIFIADIANNRVIQLTNEGDLVNIIGHDGTGPGQFRQINKIHCDKKMYLFVEDLSQARTLCYNLNGEFMLAYQGLTNIAVDPWGNMYQPLYLNDSKSRSIAVYDNNGNLAENKMKLKSSDIIKYVTMPGIDQTGNVTICHDTESFRYYTVLTENNSIVKKYCVNKKHEGFLMTRPEWISPNGEIYTARYELGKFIVYKLSIK